MTYITKEKTEKNGELLEKILKFIEDRGGFALETARKAISEEKIQSVTVREALNYYMHNLWFDVHHTGLLSMSCEAVGGDPNKTIPIGAATVMLRGGIDIHDDVIDNQKIKMKKPTVYGKYGKNIAILAGNALLFKGFALLNGAISPFSKEIGETITDLIKSAFFEIGDAVANEVEFRKNRNLTPEDYYMRVIKAKAVGGEVHMKVGAIVGGGAKKEIEALAQLGRILGVLATVRDEVIDMYEPRELGNRIKNEIPPLPILYALRSQHAKGKMNKLLRKKTITQKDAYEILDTAFNSEEYQKFRGDMKKMVQLALNIAMKIKNEKIKHTLTYLLTRSIEDI